MDRFSSKYQNILELKKVDKNESFEKLRQTALWRNHLPANYFALKDLLIEKSDSYKKSTFEISTETNIVYTEVGGQNEAQKINLLLAVLQKVLWKVARINFVNFKKISWQNNKCLTRYIFVKTKDHNSLFELVEVIDAQELRTFNPEIEGAFIEKTKANWPTFFNDVLVLQGTEVEAFNKVSKDHFLTINFTNKVDGFSAVFTINEDAPNAPFLLNIVELIKVEFEQLTQNIEFINLHINNVEPIVEKVEIEPDLDDVEFNF